MEYIELSVDFDLIKYPQLEHVTKHWQSQNGEYRILYDEVQGFKHLRIRRLDNQPIRDYMILQEIKNDLLGIDVIAVEVFPKDSDFVNNSHTYHLWTWTGITVPNLTELYRFGDTF